ncbi:MAG: TlpA family protein disulfide reductase [Chthonomonadales bacterium]|nr:TlpA family protein disulfide reductase [Chthonomonadales bacterium]
MGRKAAIVLLALLAAAWVSAEMMTRTSRGGPTAMADVAIRTPDGTVRVGDLRGKVVLVDYWATWCPPCRASIPGIEALYQRYRDRGFAVVGVSMDDSPNVVPPFIQEMGMTYPAGLPVDREKANAPPSLPTMVLLNRDGEEIWRQEGFAESVEQELRRQVEQAL